MRPYGPGIPLVVDTSAWVRQRNSAAAAERGFGVLHLDGHYDTLASTLAFTSVRLDRY